MIRTATYDPAERAREKQVARIADDQALRSDPAARERLDDIQGDKARGDDGLFRQSRRVRRAPGETSGTT